MLNREEGFEAINRLGQSRIPFLFILSYDKSKIFVKPLDNLDNDIYYKIEDWHNYSTEKMQQNFKFSKSPINFIKYKEAFEHIITEIHSGNSYLLNLTFKTPIECSLSLKEIFKYSRAKFKLYFKDEFICFSPERFINIRDNIISTYPMKGTIDANIPNAKDSILNNKKEMAEHVMIVDLMRNDLSIVAKDIKVDKFRYIKKIKAGEKSLLQVSSKITANLNSNWQDEIGTLLDKLTPAGSITGTPKKSTIDIIDTIENYDRDFYTGIFGIFDGKELRSGVMIRFIEKQEHQLFYKSGGGITLDSNAKLEYNELIDKIYLPF